MNTNNCVYVEFSNDTAGIGLTVLIRHWQGHASGLQIEGGLAAVASFQPLTMSATKQGAMMHAFANTHMLALGGRAPDPDKCFCCNDQGQDWQSNASWGAKHGFCNNITTDSHYTEGAAAAVCDKLELEGLGGERIHYPLKTWVSHKGPNFDQHVTVYNDVIGGEIVAKIRICGMCWAVYGKFLKLFMVMG